MTPPDALIVAADMGDPTIFYYAERKGWHFLEQNAIYNGTPDHSDQAIENLERLRRGRSDAFCFHPEYVLVVTLVSRICSAFGPKRDTDRGDA